MNFIEDRLLDCFLSVIIYHPASTVFYLHHLYTPTADVFTQGKVQPSLKSPIFLSLYYHKDLVLCNVILPILRPLKTLIQVLLSMLFPMLSKIITFLFADSNPEPDIFNSQLKWCIDMTLPCCSLQVPAITYLTGVPSQ
jgi:hypothetical protein